MHRFKVIALTHKNFDLSRIGKWHLNDSERNDRLSTLRKKEGINGLMYLSTCNRVEFLLDTEHQVDKNFLHDLFQCVYPGCEETDLSEALDSVQVYEGREAVRHLFGVASSIDSLVVGEREIITQVRSAFENDRKAGLTSDLIRLVVQKTIECAKQIFTQTNISRNPVSVVSLAYRKLKDLKVKLDARILIIGSGVTNTNMAKYLRKHGFSNFTIFNRTLANAKQLADELGADAFPLTDLPEYKRGFDVIVTCTAANGTIITPQMYAALTVGEADKKVVIDLAVPNDLDEEILMNFDVKLIAVNNLQEVARKNLLARQGELSACELIISEVMEELNIELKERKVELAMRSVPEKIKEIRSAAVNEVFARDLEKLDDQSRETLEKVISYLEKKYISMPMKMAKEIMLNTPEPLAPFAEKPFLNGKETELVKN